MRYLYTLKSIVLTILVSVVCADFLFYDAPIGISVAIFYTFWLVILRGRIRSGNKSDPFLNIVTGASFGVLLALLWNPSEMAIIVALTCLAILALTAKHGSRAASEIWLKRIITYYIAAVIQLWRDSSTIKRWKESGHLQKSFFEGHDLKQRWLIPILITLVFFILFTKANPLLAQWLQDFAEIIEKRLGMVSWPDLERILIWIISFLFGWGWLRYRSPYRSLIFSGRQHPTHITENIPTSTVIRSLALLNALFLFMNGLDLRYLWGNGVLPQGMTYAEYAQRGAYPLIVSALLAGAFVLFTFKPGGSSEKSKLARTLVGVWVAQNIFLTISAALRLEKYIDIYSMTRLRLAAAIWMGLVACGLLWICLRIFAQKKNEWLIRQNCLTLSLVLYVCAFINFDGLIARYNVSHCRESTGQGSPLDWMYLRTLGVEALPAVQSLHKIETMHQDFRLDLQRTEGRIERELKYRRSDWRGWSLLQSSLPDV